MQGIGSIHGILAIVLVLKHIFTCKYAVSLEDGLKMLTKFVFYEGTPSAGEDGGTGFQIDDRKQN